MLFEYCKETFAENLILCSVLIFIVIFLFYNYELIKDYNFMSVSILNPLLISAIVVIIIKLTMDNCNLSLLGDQLVSSENNQFQQGGENKINLKLVPKQREKNIFMTQNELKSLMKSYNK